MRPSRPRLGPLPESEWDDEQRDLVRNAERDGRALNIYRTLVRHPKLLKRWGVFGAHILYKNSLPPRERELLILRTGWLCRCEYEWGQHVLIARACGLTDDEIARVKDGPEAAGWSDADAALLRAADELHADAFVSDATWQALSERYDAPQLLDLVFTAGQYHVVAMALNTLGVQRDEGVPGFDG
jgi:alkylhydroperoxidase family enzyme